MAVEIPEDQVVPGDIIAFDYEILTTQENLKAWVIGRIKEEVWAHPMLDYQSSRVITVGDVELKRDVEMLRVWAQVRTHEKATHVEVQQASLAYFFAGMATATAALIAYAVLSSAKKDRGTSVLGQMVQIGENAVDLTALAIIGLVAYVLLLKE